MEPPADRPDDRSLRAWRSHAPPVEAARLPTWLVRDASIPDLLARRMRSPGRPAVSVAGTTVTYGELIRRVATTADWLRTQGVGPGDRVLISGANSVNLIVGCLAAMWAGGLEVVANPSLTARELGHIAGDCAPSAVLADDAVLTTLGQPIDGAAVASLGGPGELAQDLERIAAEHGRMLPPPGLSSDAPASLQYTSGTTGAPKGALLTHGNIVSYLRSVVIAWEWTASDVLVHSLPLSHGHGRNGVYTALLAGAACVVLERTDPAAIGAALGDAAATVFYAVPAIWDRLLAADRSWAASFASLRLYTSGSAPLSPAMSDTIADLLGRERPLERYGCTETGVVTTNPIRGTRLAGTVGLPMPGAQVRVAAADGTAVPDGDVGEIVVRGPSVFGGYWERDPGGLFLPDGWFRTGDLGTFDPERDHHLVVTGRSKEMIISGGLNVYPREVELVAEAAPDVREAAVVGVPSARWGEKVVLAVVPRDPGETFDLPGLLAFMRSRLAGYKTPKEGKVVAELPRNAAGKVLRQELVRAWDRL